MQQTLEARVAALEAALRLPVGGHKACPPPAAPADPTPTQHRHLPMRVRTAVRLAADEFDIPVLAILSPLRRHDVALARHVAATLAMRVLGMSSNLVGRVLDRDHSSILHGVAKVETMAAEDGEFAERLNRLAQQLRASSKEAA